ATYALYPPEYRIEVSAVQRPDGSADSIVAAHSLIPQALRHALSTYGVLLAPDLPLTRRQHEMIATLVSALNFSSAGVADFASGPTAPSASAAWRCTVHAGACSASVSAGTASLASGPIWPSERAACSWTGESPLLSARI